MQRSVIAIAVLTRSIRRLIILGTLLLAPALLVPAVTQAEAPAVWVDKNLEDLVFLYKKLHQAPELSFHEAETSKLVTAELMRAGFEVTPKVGGYGVVALLKNGDGPTVMFRGDMDALPVAERTDLPYASRVKTHDADNVEVSVMHACGHDIHVTNLIALGRYLAANRKEWSGTAMLIAQPAEERGAGASSMLQDGLLTRFPRPNFALALHVDATLQTGFIGYRGGYALANVDSVDITVRGRGGHGSFPQGTVDTIVQAAQLILDLQTIVSREISPLEPAVVTVGSIHAGTKHNIIPDTCHLQLTVRSYTDEVRTHIRESIIRKAQAVAQSFRAPEPIIKYSEGTPSLFNDERLVDRIVPVFQKTLGEEKIVPVDRSMGGEDFSQFGRAGIPIFLFRLGSVSPGRMQQFASKGLKPPSLHSAEYFPDPEPTLKTGFLATAAAMLELMPAAP